MFTKSASSFCAAATSNAEMTRTPKCMKVFDRDCFFLTSLSRNAGSSPSLIIAPTGCCPIDILFFFQKQKKKQNQKHNF